MTVPASLQRRGAWTPIGTSGIIEVPTFVVSLVLEKHDTDMVNCQVGFYPIINVFVMINSNLPDGKTLQNISSVLTAGLCLS